MTLLVDWNAAAADQLAAQLAHAGFPSDVANDTETALAAIKKRCFRSVIVVADLDRNECLACLRAVSRASPRSWLVVIGSRGGEVADQLVHKCGGDALVTAPFAVGSLAARLATLATHERRG